LTGKLGDAIKDKEKATALIVEIKQRVLAEKATTPQEIERIVVQVADELNVTLTDQQVDQITQLMQRINRLDLKVSELKTQLTTVEEKIDRLLADNQEVQSILHRIMQFLENIWAKLRALFG